MQYAGFPMRFGAAVVDGVLLAPLVVLYWALAALSWEVAVAAAIPYVSSYAAYNVYCHARWGQTLGKRVYGIKVVTLAGDPIRWRHALLRHSVDLVVAALSCAAWMAALFAVSKVPFGSAGFQERMHLVKEAQPAWSNWPQTVEYVWVASEMLVLLCNEKKRAIHDYLAGTVVMVLPVRGRRFSDHGRTG